MRHIDTYHIFESKESSPLSKKQIEFLNNRCHGTWTYNTETGLVDVDGHVLASRSRLKDLKGIRFGRVSGAFDLEKNKIETLEGLGLPVEIGGEFILRENQLTSLKGCLTKRVGGFFTVDKNPLVSLEGSPQEVGFKLFEDGGRFYCSSTEITSLKGMPQNVKGSVILRGNKKLVSLEGCPEEIKWNFILEGSPVKNLKGGPVRVAKKFTVAGNELESLVGGPEFVGGDYDCSNNRLKNLVGAPQKLAKRMIAINNPLESLKGIPKEVGGSIVVGIKSDSDWWDDSRVLTIKKADRDPKGIVKLLKTTDPEVKHLLLGFPPFSQDWIDENPEEAALALAPYKKMIDEYMPNLKLPDAYKDEFDDFSDLKDLGF